MYMYNPYMQQYRHQNPTTQRVMTVSGSGTVSVEPNLVTIQLAIVTENEQLQIAQQENAETSNQVIQSLLNLGISQENIQTSAYIINPVYDFVDGNQQLRGYHVEHSLTVNIDSVEDTGVIIDTAVENGVNQISNIQFSVDNEEEYYRQALNLALADAIAKAESMAESLHLNLDANPIKIDERKTEQPIAYKTFAMEAGSQTTPIQPGQILVEATVQTQFQYSS